MAKKKKNALFKTYAEAQKTMKQSIMKLAFAGVANTAFDMAADKLKNSISNDLIQKLFGTSVYMTKTVAGAGLAVFANKPEIEAAGIALFSGGASKVLESFGLAGIDDFDEPQQNVLPVTPAAQLPEASEELEKLVEQFDRQANASVSDSNFTIQETMPENEDLVSKII